MAQHKETITEDGVKLAQAQFAEWGVLGSLLTDPDTYLPHAIAELMPEHFYLPTEQRMFAAILRCHGDGIPIDFATIHGIVGGTVDIFMRYVDVATPRSFEYQIRVIKAAWTRRKAQYILKDAMAAVGQFDIDLVAQFKMMSDDVIAMIVRDNTPKKMGDLIVDTLKDIEMSKVRYIPTGLQELDNLVGGFTPGHLWVIAGRTSMGKTTMAQNLCLNVAKAGKPVGYLAIEDDYDELRQRFISMQSGVSLSRMSRRALTESDAIRITDAAGVLADVPLYTVEKESEWSKIQARVKLLKFKVPELRVVFIDYLNLIKHNVYRNRWENIAEISANAKTLARELSITVVLLCQINRQTENRRNHKPTMGDLRDSGSIEQDADVIMLIYRKSYYDKSGDPTAQISVAKQRNGPTGGFELEFDGDCLRFL